MKQFLLLFLACVFCQQTNAQLAYRPVLSNAASIKMPADFSIMKKELVQLKYPQNPPAEVYTDSAARVNLNFKITKQPLEERDVFKAGPAVENQIISMLKCEKVSSEQIIVNGARLYVFSFISQAVDVPIYNQMFIFSLNGKLTLGSFNCVIRLRDQWESTAKEMVRSIKFPQP